MQLDQFIKYSEFLHSVPNLGEFDIHGYDISEDQTLPELLNYLYLKAEDSSFIEAICVSSSPEA